MKKVITIVGFVTLLIMVSSAFTGNSISFMAILNNLSTSSEVITSQGADFLFKRVYEVSPNILSFTISSDWGYYNFLRSSIVYLVRGFGVFLDIGNYIVWIVNALWMALLYFTNLFGLLLGLG